MRWRALAPTLTLTLTLTVCLVAAAASPAGGAEGGGAAGHADGAAGGAADRDGAGARAVAAEATAARLRRPTDLVARGLSPQALRLTWVDAAQGEDGFVVEGRVLGAPAWTRWLEAPADARGATIEEGLEPETGYEVRVSAVRGARSTRPSVPAMGTTWGVPGECTPSATTLCLGDGAAAGAGGGGGTGRRFRVEARFEPSGAGDPTGTAQVALVGPALAGSGAFWFIDPSRWEVLVRVEDACSPADPAGPAGNPAAGVSILAGGVTTWRTTVTVVDTTTGRAATVFHPGGRPFQTVRTEAFACP